MENLRGATYLLRGSPATVFYVDEDVFYVVDPGHGGKRAKELRRIARSIGKPAVILLTHYHSDHLEVLNHNLDFPYTVVTSELDRAGAEYPEYRTMMTFGVPLEAWREAQLFETHPVRVDKTLRCGESLGPLRTIHLPGHTPGQIGVLTPDGVLHAGDAVFGEKVLENYLVPYHRDPCMALESLERLTAAEFDVLVPGHGPVVERGPAMDLINVNMRIIRGFLDKLLEEAGAGKTYQEILNAVVAGRSVNSSGEYLLVEQSVRGGLACLAGRGLVTLNVRVTPPRWERPV